MNNVEYLFRANQLETGRDGTLRLELFRKRVYNHAGCDT